jgi:hypothetical protein
MKNNDEQLTTKSYVVVRDSLERDGLELFKFGLEVAVGRAQLEQYIALATTEILEEDEDEFQDLDLDDIQDIADQIVVLEVTDYNVPKLIKRHINQNRTEERQLYLRLKRKYERST